MDVVTKVYVQLSEGKIARRYSKLTTGSGQTMTEYAMIVSTVAVVAYGGYKTFGTSITGLLTSIDGSL
jgi:Flp pilus assembly pilin Flp